MRTLTAALFLVASVLPVGLRSENEKVQLQPGVGGISMSITPTTLTGGMTATGTITLMRPGLSRVSIHISSSNEAVVSVPAEVNITPRQSSVTFNVTTHPTSVVTDVTIAASLSTRTATSKVTVAPPVLAAIALNQPSVVALGSVTGTITLTGAAPPSGVVISLSTDKAAAAVPASIQVSGSAQRTFTVTTNPVAATTNVTISASSGAVTKTAVLAVTASTASSGVSGADDAVKGFGNCMTRADFDTMASGGAAFSSLPNANTTGGACYACHSAGGGGAFLSQNGNDTFASNRSTPYILKLAMPSQKPDGSYTLLPSNRFRDHGAEPGTHPRYVLSPASQAAIDQYFSRTLARFLANTNGCRSNPSN